MRICKTAIFMVILIGSIKCKLTLVDLTHDFGNITTVYWPTEQQHRFKLLTLDRFDDGNSYYESNRFSTAEHGGTHMDAPRHFAKNKQGVNEIPLSNLVGLAYIADFTNESSNDADFQIEDKHLMAYEEKHGKINDDSILLLYTGFSSQWPDLNTYLGTNSTNVSLLHFPGLHPNGAQWLVNNRKIKALGIDTASLDYGQSTEYMTHVTLLTKNIPGFENVNLDALKKYKDRKDMMIYALPMKIKDGSGAPLRIIASFDDASSSSTATFSLPSMFLLLLVLTIFHCKHIIY